MLDTPSLNSRGLSTPKRQYGVPPALHQGRLQDALQGLLKALFLEEQIPSYLITKPKHTHTHIKAKANEKRFAGDL